MRIGFVTDVHFGPEARHEGRLRKLSAIAEPLLRDFVERMNTVDKPQLVVNLGDVIEDESAELDRARYQRFVDILGGAEAEVVHVAGNHDQMHLPDEELARLMHVKGPLWRSFDAADFHFVVLCTRYVPRRSVHLPEEQISWLESDLASTDKPTIVLVHHPLCEMNVQGNRWFEKQPHVCRVTERRRVREVLEKSCRVRAVFNGHAHWNYVSVINGIPYVTLQSLIENLDEDAPGRPARAHAIADLSPHGLRVQVRGAESAHYQFDW